MLVVPAQALAANITVSATGFTPASLTINQGDTVTWTNPDTATHQIVSRKAGFSSPVLSTGQTFSFVFKSAGSFTIQETLDKKLKGTVVVQATPKTAPSASIAFFASKTAVLYGSTVTLSGTVSSKQSGEHVTSRSATSYVAFVRARLGRARFVRSEAEACRDRALTEV